jgi:hypothetical protein
MEQWHHIHCLLASSSILEWMLTLRQIAITILPSPLAVQVVTRSLLSFFYLVGLTLVSKNIVRCFWGVFLHYFCVLEHRDKKGFTPLILAATAGHEKVVEILLNHGADIEAQSERTKDTPLSLACSGGRIEVVNLLLSRSANKEHRNVSDYTPLSLAASGGYVNIIKLLLNAGAEINSRTGSKLGISPLMLAAMNGHTG